MPLVAPLVALGTLAIVLWVIAIASAIAVIMGYISGQLSGLPYPLDKIAGPVKSLGQGINNVCGKLEAGVDHLVGVAWHAMARYADKLWNHLEDQAKLDWLIAKTLADHLYGVTGLRSVVHGLTQLYHGIEHRVKSLEHEWHGIEHRVKSLEHEMSVGIGDDVLPRLKSLDRELGKVEHKVIPRLRADVATAENDVTALQEWVSKNALLVGTTAVTGAVAWALSQLGLGGLRCPTLLRSLSKRGCGLWNGLEDLLGLFIDALALTHLCDLPKWIEELFSPILGELTGLISSAANSLCAQANSKWATLDVPAGPQPPAQTLYLPDHFG